MTHIKLRVESCSTISATREEEVAMEGWARDGVHWAMVGPEHKLDGWLKITLNCEKTQTKTVYTGIQMSQAQSTKIHHKPI